MSDGNTLTRLWTLLLWMWLTWLKKHTLKLSIFIKKITQGLFNVSIFIYKWFILDFNENQCRVSFVSDISPEENDPEITQTSPLEDQKRSQQNHKLSSNLQSLPSKVNIIEHIKINLSISHQIYQIQIIWSLQ